MLLEVEEVDVVKMLALPVIVWLLARLTSPMKSVEVPSLVTAKVLPPS